MQGPIDLAVLNAGIYEPVPADWRPQELFRQHMEVNYQGVVNGLCPPPADEGTGERANRSTGVGGGLPRATPSGRLWANQGGAHQPRRDLASGASGNGGRSASRQSGLRQTRLTAKNRFFMPSILTPEEAAKRISPGSRAVRSRSPFRLASSCG